MISYKETLAFFTPIAPELYPKCLNCHTGLLHFARMGRGSLVLRYCAKCFFQPVPKTATLPRGLRPDRRINR